MVLGLFTLLSWVLRLGISSIAGERLTRRLRNHVFSEMLRQPATWHDQPEHETGRLTHVLTDDVVAVRNMGIEYYSLAVTLIFLMLGGLASAFAFCWQEAFVVLAVAPLIASSGFVMVVLDKFNKKSDNALRPAAAHLALSLNYYRVILSLGRSTAYCSESTRRENGNNSS